jgi:hypothetical protein
MGISPDRATVAAAISAAAQGATIGLNAGNVTWSSPITINLKAVKIIGAGQGQTNIAITGGGIFDWYFPDNDYVCEVGNITFNMSGAGGGITVGGNDPHYGRPNGFRFHHLTFTNSSDRAIDVSQVCVASGTPTTLLSGCIDHCIFNDVSSSSNKQIIVNGCSGSSANPSDAYKALANFPYARGNNYHVYIEDCTFNYNSMSDGSMDAYNGARYVFRHNIVNNTNLEHHGCDSGGSRGTMSFEVYENVFTNTSAMGRAGHYRSGTGVFFNNTYTGNYSTLDLVIYRVDESFAPWGRCIGTSSWDANVNGLSGNNARGDGWACLDNPGHVFGATTGGANTLKPLYAWNNTKGGASFPLTLSDQHGPNQAQYIAANREYYQGGIVAQTSSTSPFNGTTGMGFGTLARRPASGLTTGVGYWATDTQTLYTATGPTTWATEYTPYTYPHPLQGTTSPPVGTPVLSVR